MHRAMHVAPWQVTATIVCVASLAASTVSLARHLNADPAASSVDRPGVGDAAVPALASAPPSLVSVAPLNGRLVIVFPGPSTGSSIRLERYGGAVAMFGAPRIERAPLLVLPGELRVRELPDTGADFELRIPASVTRVDVRIGGRMMARWSGTPLTWEYGRRVPIQLPAPG
jgi:hypothetical protein